MIAQPHRRSRNGVEPRRLLREACESEPEAEQDGAWAVAAFCVAPILWAAGSLSTAHADQPADRVVANAVQLLAGSTVLLLLALSLGELDPARWSDVSSTSVGAAAFLLVFDSLAGFMLYMRLLATRQAPLVSTYAYVTPLVGAVMGATVLRRATLWTGAFVGAALVLGAVALELRGDERHPPARRTGDRRACSLYARAALQRVGVRRLERITTGRGARAR